MSIKFYLHYYHNTLFHNVTVKPSELRKFISVKQLLIQDRLNASIAVLQLLLLQIFHYFITPLSNFP